MKIIIIGGVAAGMSAAAKAGRINKDAKITIYEKTGVVSWGACGLPYFVGDFFSDSSVMIARAAEDFIKSGMDLRINHEVISVDPEKKVIKVKNLNNGAIFEDSYDKLMIATGAHAIIPPIKNAALENVSTLKDFTDGTTVKNIAMNEEIQNIVIIGAGYIGLETVEAMYHLNKKSIRIIQHSERILNESFDSEITDIFQNEISSYKNISLHLSESAIEFKDVNGKVSEVITSKGAYPCDLVIIATGIRPNTAFLKDTGINMLPNGALIIDNHGMTSIDSIYSAGDCATTFHLVSKQNAYIPLATTANKIGRVVGENLAGLDTTFNGSLGSACVKIMKMEGARTGITEGEAKKLGLNYKTVFVKDKNQTGYYPGQHDIWVKLIYDADTRVILGGQIAGKKGAVLRVDTLATAITCKMTVDDLGMLDLCYSPPFARTWDVLNVAGNVAK